VRAPRPGNDDGAAVVDFVLVSGLVATLFVLVFQVGLALHTRTVLVSLAAEGARYGADADVADAGQVEARTRAAISDAFNPRFASQAVVTPVLGGPVVEVRITAPLPLAFLPAGPLTLTVAAHALEEQR
jgi:hypothetical protein